METEQIKFLADLFPDSNPCYFDNSSSDLWTAIRMAARADFFVIVGLIFLVVGEGFLKPALNEMRPFRVFSFAEKRRGRRNLQLINITSISDNQDKIDWTISNEDAPCFQVDGVAFIETNHIKFLGFDNLFPGSNLSERFDNSSDLRTAIRMAARADFFVPDQSLTAEVNALLIDPRSSLMSSWRRRNSYSNLTSVFAEHSISLTGVVIFKPLSPLFS